MKTSQVATISLLFLFFCSSLLFADHYTQCTRCTEGDAGKACIDHSQDDREGEYVELEAGEIAPGQPGGVYCKVEGVIVGDARDSPDRVFYVGEILPGTDAALSNFGIDVTVGIAGIDTFESNQFTTVVTPRLLLQRADSMRIDLTFPIIFIPGPYPDPWASPCFPDLEPCPFGDFFVTLKASDLEVGPTLSVAPSVEFTFRTNQTLRPSVFLGAGFLTEGGRSTEVEGLGTFRTTDSSSPLVTYGIGLSYGLSDRIALRLEGRFITAFMDTMTVTAPDDSRATLEGDTVTSGVVTIGLGYSF